MCVCMSVHVCGDLSHRDVEGLGGARGPKIYILHGVAEWTWRGFRRIRRDAEGRRDTPFFLLAARYINSPPSPPPSLSLSQRDTPFFCLPLLLCLYVSVYTYLSVGTSPCLRPCLSIFDFNLGFYVAVSMSPSLISLFLSLSLGLSLSLSLPLSTSLSLPSDCSFCLYTEKNLAQQLHSSQYGRALSVWHESVARTPKRARTVRRRDGIRGRSHAKSRDHKALPFGIEVIPSNVAPVPNFFQCTPLSL